MSHDDKSDKAKVGISRRPLDRDTLSALLRACRGRWHHQDQDRPAGPETSADGLIRRDAGLRLIRLAMLTGQRPERLRLLRWPRPTPELRPMSFRHDAVSFLNRARQPKPSGRGRNKGDR